MRFLALGDSYTIGEGVGTAERWPMQLAVLLRQHGLALDEPVIIATTGWTTDELAAGIVAAAPAGPYELVALLIGVNNQFRGRPVQEYREQFATLLRRAIELAGGQAARVMVLSIPDWGVAPFAAGRETARIAADIDHFNAANFAEAARAGANYVDVTPSSRRALDDPALIAPDGLHPSGAMYAEWASLALPIARMAVGSQSI